MHLTSVTNELVKHNSETTSRSENGIVGKGFDQSGSILKSTRKEILVFVDSVK